MQLTQDIIDDFKAGRVDAFYREAYPALLIYATRILSDGYTFLAEDCVQDCIFRSYQQRDKITDPLSWRSFLYTSVHNEAVSILRHHQAHEKYVSQPGEVVSPDSSLAFIEQETLDLLYSAIQLLPEKYRILFELSFEQGLTNPEIAELLNLSVSGVKKQKSKMLQHLRTSLSKDAILTLMITSIC